MNVLMPRCLLSRVILLEISPTYRWKIYLTRKNAHKKLDQKFFLDTRARKTTCCPSLCKTKDSLRPQHATNWEIICTNWEEHLLIGKSIQRDMLNKASRQDARPIKLDPKFLIQEVVGKNCGHLGSSPFYARCMADLRSGLEHPK